MSARRPAPLVPLTLAVGVQEQFGWLVDPTDSHRRRLCEVVRLSRDEAILTCLDDGSKFIAPADGSRQWQQLRPEVACALVGMPEPPRHNQWRLDPFWVERHRSAEWRALVELVVSRRLPVHYAAVMFARGEWDPALWDGPCADSAEIFACGVIEGIARGLTMRSAIDARLDADHNVDIRLDPMHRTRLLLESGWLDALRVLPSLIDAQRTVLARGGRRPDPPVLAAASAALAAPTLALELPGLHA
jgi:hypothetical protein